MAITTIDFIGDSEVAGTLFSCNQMAGGLGNHVETAAQRLGNIQGVGPYLSPGLRSVAVGIGPFATDWSFAGSWTTVLSTDAWDRIHYGYGKYGSGSTLIATWPKPSRMPPIVGFDYWWVDLASGGNCSYSLDGGSTYTTLTETIHGDNLLNKCYIPQAINSNGFKVKMADASNNAVIGMPAGITPYYADPRSATTGVIFNSIAVNGQQLHNLVQSTSGDRMAFLGSVRLGSGSPISSDPTMTLMLHVNDIEFANATQWGTDLSTFYAKASPFGPVTFVKPWNLETADYDVTQQALYAAQTSTSALSLGASVLDMNRIWTDYGFPDLATQSAQFLADSLHPAQRGHLDIGTRVYWHVRKTLLSSYGNNPTTYPVSGKRAAVAYGAKAATVAYSAGQPISVVPV